MKFLKIHHPFDARDTHLIQEYYRERFYGAVTLIALHITLLSSSSDMNPSRAFSTVFFTTLGLWLASLLAGILSHRVSHHEGAKQSFEIRKTLLTHWGLIASGIPSLLCISVSVLGFLSLREALIGAILVSVIRIATTVTLAFMKNDRHPALNALSLLLQIAAIACIIYLKLSAEK